MVADNPQKWSVLSGLFLVYMASNGITLHTLPLLYPELMEEFGWRESEVTLPATVFFIVGAFTSPPAGWLLDRYSSRTIITLGSLLLSLALLGYSATHTLWELVAIYAVLGIAFVSLRPGLEYGHAHKLVRRVPRTCNRHFAHGIELGRGDFPPRCGDRLRAPRVAPYRIALGFCGRCHNAAQRVAPLARWPSPQRAEPASGR